MSFPDYFRTDPACDVAVTASKDAEARLVFNAIEHLAARPGPVLILGEPGSGRGAVARRLHELGAEAGAPLVEIDSCDLDGTALLSGEQIGTVFLREIEDLDFDLQPALAALLEQSGPSGCRIVVSGPPDLATQALDGGFSGALLGALGRVSLQIPPLRDRAVDIPDLVGFLLDRYSVEVGVPVGLAEAAMGYLIEYDWPGNIAELEHVVGRLCESAEGEFVSADQLPPQIRWCPRSEPDTRTRSKCELGFDPLAEEFQYRLIADALRRTLRR